MTDHPIATEYVPCDLCGSTDQTILFSKYDPITKQEYAVVECRCGMAFVNPMPTEESLPLLYPQDYLKDKPGMESLYRRMAHLLPEVQGGGTLLDLGCGRGDFIAYAARNGWNAEGVDLMPWETQLPVPIHVGNFLEMDLEAAHYDVVTAWALLEHVRTPSGFFERVPRLLKSGGRFIFVVPNFAAPGMRCTCTEDIPRHLWLFTPQAVAAYLSKNGMAARVIFHNDILYTAYPFGLLRYAVLNLFRPTTSCTGFGNQAVALLQNRQVQGNTRWWLSQIAKNLGPVDMAVDAMDLCLGVLVAEWSKLIGNYGVMTVVATREEDQTA
jgi:SAM-dependent methyltransferase